MPCAKSNTMGVDRMIGWIDWTQLALLFMIYWKLDKVQYRQWMGILQESLGDEEE